MLFLLESQIYTLWLKDEYMGASSYQKTSLQPYVINSWQFVEPLHKLLSFLKEVRRHDVSVSLKVGTGQELGCSYEGNIFEGYEWANCLSINFRINNMNFLVSEKGRWSIASFLRTHSCKLGLLKNLCHDKFI